MLYRLVFALAIALAPVIAAAQSAPAFTDDPQLPEGVRGERVEALVGALNSNSAEAIEQVFEKHVAESFRAMAPMERHVDIFKSTFRQTNGVDFHSTRTYDPPMERTVVIVRDRLYGGWHSLVLDFAGDDDLISGIQFTPARTPSALEPEALSEGEMIEEVRAAVSRGCSADVFSGTVLVAKGGDVLYESACGEASKRFGAEINLETKFNLGSMNKMFTAVAVMQLVEEGRLSVDDPIREYVDESWLPREITDRVTVHHLLTHTSGLGSYFNETFVNSSRALYRELDDYKPLVQGDTLAFEPGERFRYSNTGMLLLGVVIESVTGQSYFDVVREKIYVPAGMANTDSYSMDEPVPNLAIGYIPAPESEYGWRNNIFEHVMKGGPAGGGFSTAGDLHRFAVALRAGKLLKQETLEKMWTSHSNGSYGYGFGIANGPAGKVIGHSGGFPGLNSNLDVFVDAGYSVAVMSNYDRAASPLADHIRSLVHRLEPM